MDNNSCQNFSFGSTSSSELLGLPPPCVTKKKKPEKIIVEQETSPKCSQLITSTSTSSSTTISMGAFDSDCHFNKALVKEPPNIDYEVNVAKAIMQQYSTLSGDNLFDHLSDIIKRVIDERPPNVIDFFEEFSRNVREQKFHLPERFPPNGIFDEVRTFKVAKQILQSMQLPYNIEGEDLVGAEDLYGEDGKTNDEEELRIVVDDSMRQFVTFNERVQQLQFYWNQCGFSISNDDIFQLACAMNRLQTHSSIMQCRFWGCINGLKASYYIVEATLTREEIQSRLAMMQDEMREKQLPIKMRHDRQERPLPPHIGPELTPGIYGWEGYAIEELENMKPKAADVPLVEEIEFYDIPPEYIGVGCNRYSYFVVNSLSDDWIELPIVTPRQVVISRQIKKFLTGDLEADVISYPCFPGKEKHYLRAMIGRITAGTYIAPIGYYRRMTKKEKRAFEGELDEGEEEEEEDEEDEDLNEGEDQIEDNDVMLLKNEKYEAETLGSLATPVAWVHVRSNILNQGRVVWFNEEKAQKEREKALALYLKMRLMEEMEEELEEEEDVEDEEEGEEEGMIEGLNQPETGPSILSSCANDMSPEIATPWLIRQTSKYTNQKERVLLMQSNVWPGAHTFIFEKTCESIYLGWGHKYHARNMPFNHLPMVQEEYTHGAEDFIEASDPTVEEEAAYREWLLSKQRKPASLGEDIEEFDDEDGDESEEHSEDD
ncbi:LOW QUALITY PROTEIN: radial spoke head protein 4 homolog A [Drosophila subobscura]|uniref:LOW QUALITY PROTEIN: radial spoke head protein 4 homolog A n=1 Tax=Drosophila subobscura TaxID=7241 RepID=UPI00155AB56A|nr:LOW QUALITY PROTEIN: radial spoke head protein 4 homolog A [Drosophila subobscura]